MQLFMGLRRYETNVYWSITGGAQQDRQFFIDPDSGALSFKTVDTNGDAI